MQMTERIIIAKKPKKKKQQNKMDIVFAQMVELPF